MTRDCGSPKYRRWRAAVYARDGHACRVCGSTDGLNAHHIKTWARHPRLRFAVSNGVTLCRVHHELVTGDEARHESALSRLVRPHDRGVALELVLMRHAEDG